MEVFLTAGRWCAEPLLGDVVWEYDIYKEIDVGLTTRLDPLSANVLCDYLLLSHCKKGLRQILTVEFVD